MNSKIKILHIQETIHSGGVEKRRLLLAKYLDKSIYEQKIICTFAEGPILSQLKQEGVEVIPIGKFHGPFDFLQYKKIIQIINEYQPHIIHGAVFEGVTMACVCGFLKRVPVIIAEETSDPQNRSKKASFLLKLLTLVADRVVAISPGTEEYLKKVAKMKSSKIQLINNGVEFPRKIDDNEIKRTKEQFQIRENDFVVGSVGRLRNNHKRFTDLIDAVAWMKDRSNVKILIVGEGRDKELIEQHAASLNLSDHLIMVGYQEDTSLYYQMMDTFCLVSQYEGFGLVAAEAMLNELPVIATAVGGLKSVVENETSGFLVPVNDPQAIAEKLEILMNDPIKRKQFGQKGYERAMKEYSAKVYVGKIDKMYQELYKKKIKHS